MSLQQFMGDHLTGVMTASILGPGNGQNHSETEVCNIHADGIIWMK